MQKKTRGQVGGLNVERKLIKLDIDYDETNTKRIKSYVRFYVQRR